MATGNLNWRKDVNRNLKENFTYDILNRLTSASIEGGATTNFSYYANGNIQSTTPAGTYSYESSRPHAVTSVTNPDNLISTYDQEIEYTSFNKAKRITEFINEFNELIIFYGVDKQRRKIEKRIYGDLALTRYYAHYNYEKDIIGSTVTERHYISGGTGLAAIFEKVGTNENMYYIHKDHLGSISCITNQSGSLVEELSFNPWGRRRNPTNWTYTGLPSSFIFDRGFTGHVKRNLPQTAVCGLVELIPMAKSIGKHLDEFVLINMNGRVYDPIVGRFLSPDIVVQAPENTQSYNHYTYCLNNPLKYTDPSGWSLSDEWYAWKYSDGRTPDQVYWYSYACHYTRGDVGYNNYKGWGEPIPTNYVGGNWYTAEEYQNLQYQALREGYTNIYGEEYAVNAYTYVASGGTVESVFIYKSADINGGTAYDPFGLFAQAGDPYAGIRAQLASFDAQLELANFSEGDYSVTVDIRKGNVRNHTSKTLIIRTENPITFKRNGVEIATDIVKIPANRSYAGRIDGLYIRDFGIIKVNDFYAKMRFDIYDNGIRYRPDKMIKNIQWNQLQGSETFFKCDSPPPGWISCTEVYP